MNKIKALQSLKPNAQWVIRDDVIEWIDTVQTQPTDAEITAEISRLQADYDAKQYARDRAKAYAPLSEQLDMQYWDAINNTETWLDHIRSVKEANPKEGE